MSEKAVVVTDSCPHCEELKKELEKKGLLDKVKIINASTKEGLKFAKAHGIKFVPQCVIIDGKRVEGCSETDLVELLGEEDK